MTGKYLFLDIDGTIVDFDCTMPESTETALKAAQKNGHKLIVCTGRCTGQIYPWLLEKIKFDGFITSSGARVCYNGKTVSEKLFSREQLEFVADCLNKTGASVYGHLDMGLVATKKDIEGIFRVFDSIGIARDAAASLLGGLNEVESIQTDGIERLVYCGASLGIDEMRSLLGDGYMLDPYSFKNMPDTSGEMNLAGVNKASGLHELINYLGADIKDTIAFGDNWNDITMIRAAGFSVLMGSAPDGLKPEADMVTDHIKNDGFYNAFVRLGLI